MTTHLHREIENLKREILALGAMAEAAVRDATCAIENRDERLARDVIGNDIALDEMEVRIEESCFKTLALHQPVASDLRFIIAVLKINGDLERVGDLAVNVAEHAVFLATRPPVGVSFDFAEMARRTREMLGKSLDSLVHRSVQQAREVLVRDDEIDAMNRKMYLIVQRIGHVPACQTESLIHRLSACQHLERIADHATNIAEDVIYMIDGVIVRHRTEDYLHDPPVCRQTSAPDTQAQPGTVRLL